MTADHGMALEWNVGDCTAVTAQPAHYYLRHVVAIMMQTEAMSFVLNGILLFHAVSSGPFY